MRSPQPVAAAAASSPPIGPPPGPPPERFADASWEALGTRVVLRLTDPRALAPHARRSSMSWTRSTARAAVSARTPSIARVNASAGRAVHVSPLLADALALALRAAALTDGDVDPTVGSALVLAGYDRDWSLLEHSRPEDLSLREPAPLSTPAPPIIAARAVCGWRNVMLDHATLTVRVPAGFTIDLGATAKAWAADRAAHAAALAGDCGALVGVGGDIAIRGPAPDARLGCARDRRSPQRPDRAGPDGLDPLRRPGHLQHRRAALEP